MIETLAVLAIVAFIMAGASISLSNMIGGASKQTYIHDLESIQSLIVKGRAYAKASRLNDNWGIKQLIANATECGTSAAANCFVLFKGKDYATRTSDYDEILVYNSGLGRWGETNNESEFYWQKMTGWAVGLDNATNTDATAFRFRNSDGSFDCNIVVGVFGVVYNSCE